MQQFSVTFSAHSYLMFLLFLNQSFKRKLLLPERPNLKEPTRFPLLSTAPPTLLLIYTPPADGDWTRFRSCPAGLSWSAAGCQQNASWPVKKPTQPLSCWNPWCDSTPWTHEKFPNMSAWWKLNNKADNSPIVCWWHRGLKNWKLARFWSRIV